MDEIEGYYHRRMGPAWPDPCQLSEPKGFLFHRHHVVLPKVPGRMVSLSARTHDLVSAMAGFAQPVTDQTTAAEGCRPWNTPMLTVDSGGS